MNMQRLAQANTKSYDTFVDDQNTTGSEAVQSDYVFENIPLPISIALNYS